MEAAVKAITEATEKALGAVFFPAKEPVQRYHQAVQILAELERLGWSVERMQKKSNERPRR